MSEKSKNSTSFTKSFPLQKKRIPIVSIALGLITAYIVSTILKIEIYGRRRLKSADEWRELIKEHPYQKTDTDLRSPCPMLNTLANHGFIARDGRNIRSEDFFNAIMLMGAPPTASALFLASVYTLYKEPRPHESIWTQFKSMDTIDLDRFTISGVVEHDVSLTRNDSAFAYPDTSHVVPQLVNRMTKFAKHKNQGELKGIFTRNNEHDIRMLRWMESMRDNRHMHLSFFSQFASSTECTLLMDIIGRDGSITLPHLESFLLYETFPEDWYPRKTAYSLKELVTKPLICWHGLRKSQVSLDVINEL